MVSLATEWVAQATDHQDEDKASLHYHAAQMLCVGRRDMFAYAQSRYRENCLHSNSSLRECMRNSFWYQQLATSSTLQVLEVNLKRYRMQLDTFAQTSLIWCH